MGKSIHSYEGNSIKLLHSLKTCQFAPENRPLAPKGKEIFRCKLAVKLNGCRACPSLSKSLHLFFGRVTRAEKKKLRSLPGDQAEGEVGGVTKTKSGEAQGSQLVWCLHHLIHHWFIAYTT